MRMNERDALFTEQASPDDGKRRANALAHLPSTDESSNALKDLALTLQEESESKGNNEFLGYCAI